METSTITIDNTAFHWFRDNFAWGNTPAFRTDDKRQFLFYVPCHGFLFPRAMLYHLLDTWRPVAMDEQNAFCNLRRDFREWFDVKDED